MNFPRKIAIGILGMAIASGTSARLVADATAPHEVESLRITILSTMLAQVGIGEWGFAALVEADGHRLLFDTGHYADTVLQNASTLGVDLSNVVDVVLSHNHGDHTGGLLSLRRHVRERAPSALSRLHVGRGIFWERPDRQPGWRDMTEIRTEYESLGGVVHEYAAPAEIHPGIWVTGPVPRVHPERNYGNPFRPGAPGGTVISPEGPVEDNIPESLSLVINTAKGLIVISGCGHAGMINILDYARNTVRASDIHAAIGGFHLFNSSDHHLAWTADRLRDMKLGNFIGAHCTGLEPVYRFRELLGLDRAHAVVGATGATFSLDRGIEALSLAR